ncbi:MAG: type II toxin-antitoxin system RelE/ParE family toxin [Candidatus Caldarchaeum sp.]|uniref:Type II toxin-antitoxin system RelE/ParE family toxin n=1 Tax=Caldiarchaeum subterraneum TaxID=311458 RepID=A0A7C4I5L4_CALS0|nr:type II toxin-antitoxin system RelE/ParE family toxin [Candidatus Caldarchaeales archaeon]MDJ0272292.1 type II toxin-antitoxin system RelE/ParE family toxin [Candidatus Caldarchaeales archaeon]
MEKYRLIATSRFEKSFLKMDKQTKLRIDEQLRILEKDPYAGKQLHGDLKGKYSLRIGDYRVIYVINQREKAVYLLDIGHREAIY